MTHGTAGHSIIRMVVVSVTFLISFGVTAATAEVFEYELPDLAGPSTGDRMTTMTYTGPSGSVNSLTVRVEGTVDVLGFVVCEGVVPPDTSVWPLGPGSHMLKPGDTGYWLGSGSFLETLGAFDDSWTHHTFNGGFSELATGDQIEVHLYFGPTALVGICSPIGGPTAGTATRVTLSIDVSPSVPTGETTWGRIKSLF